MDVSSISLVADSLTDIINLERIVLNVISHDNVENVKKIVKVLEFQSETLKKLRFCQLNFEHVNLSSMSILERLERLEFAISCKGFVQHYDKKIIPYGCND